jgi:hypothetical protein
VKEDHTDYYGANLGEAHRRPHAGAPGGEAASEDASAISPLRSIEATPQVSEDHYLFAESYLQTNRIYI